MLADISQHFNLTFPPKPNDLGVVEYTLYQIEAMTRQMSRQISEENKQKYNLMLASNYTTEESVSAFYNSL